MDTISKFKRIWERFSKVSRIRNPYYKPNPIKESVVPMTEGDLIRECQKIAQIRLETDGVEIAYNITKQHGVPRVMAIVVRGEPAITDVVKVIGELMDEWDENGILKGKKR